MEEQTKNKYVIGVIGALIGALIGAIPWVLMYIFANMMYALLSMLIVLCSYYGYKLTKAKIDKKLPVILAITSFISITVTMFIIIPVCLMVKEGMPVSLENMQLLYQYDEFTSALMTDYMISLLFCALVIGGIIFNLNKQLKNGVSDKDIKLISQDAGTDAFPKEDIDKGYDESESIKNQRTLLTKYVENLEGSYELIDIYIDQGFTGTNFNRPDFQRMIKDINLGKINMVITKDLSRLGRDYIETGEYIEKWFPEKNVRYVSITDGIDTFANNNGNNDIAPFKSILNDMYSKDLSKKIRTALHTMQKEGKWVGGKTALGYVKSPKDKNKLIICEQEAKIVKQIFNMAISRKSNKYNKKLFK